jgi:hypothetical protein
MDIADLKPLIPSLWDKYKEGINTSLFDEDSESAGLALEWIAAYYPGFLYRYRKRILDTRSQYYKRPNIGTDYWDKLLSADCVLYFLLKHSRFLNVAIANIDHHNSSFRELVLYTLYYVAPFLEFDKNSEFIRRTESNLKYGHFYSDDNLYLIDLMKGERKDKIRLYNSWLKNPDVIKFGQNKGYLKEYINYKNHINPFTEMEYRVWEFLAKQMLSYRPNKHKQLKMFDMKSYTHKKDQEAPKIKP